MLVTSASISRDVSVPLILEQFGVSTQRLSVMMLITCCFSALHLQLRDCIWRKLQTLLLLGIVIIKMREGAESAALHCCQDSKALLQFS